MYWDYYATVPLFALPVIACSTAAGRVWGIQGGVGVRQRYPPMPTTYGSISARQQLQGSECHMWRLLSLWLCLIVVFLQLLRITSKAEGNARYLAQKGEFSTEAIRQGEQ